MKRFAVLVIILLVLAVPSGIVLAAPTWDTVVASGESIPNDVIVFNENLDVAEGATVTGDVVVFNGNAHIAGTVNGDVVLFNGDLTAPSTAVISGDCVLINGELDDQTETGLDCNSVGEFNNLFATLGTLAQDGDFPGIATAPEVRVERPTRGGLFGNLVEAVINSLVLGALAYVAASLLPQHLRQVQTAVKQKPVASGTVGVLTAVAVPSLMALLSVISAILLIVCIGILGFGVVIALALGLAAALIFGWITAGTMVGEWLADPLKLKKRTLPMTAAVGTVALTLGIGVLDALLPVVGLVSGLILAVGLGAVALTQFGTRPYPTLAGGGDAPVTIHEDPDKVSSILETLPVDEPLEIKDSDLD